MLNSELPPAIATEEYRCILELSIKFYFENSDSKGVMIFDLVIYGYISNENFTTNSAQ